MNPDGLLTWWRSSPLTQRERNIIGECVSAHANAARRENISSVVLCQALQGSGRIENAVAAALLSTGNMHAPFDATFDMLSLADPVEYIDRTLSQPGRYRVPGWGSSFAKGGPDPLLAALAAFHERRLDPLTAAIQARGRPVWPNLSAYTAATALELGMPAEGMLWMFVTGRMPVWCAMAAKR